MTYSKERMMFSNIQVYWYFYIVGWGKTGPAHSPPPIKCFNLSVFWIILLFHCILTLMNNLFLYLNNFEWPNPKRKLSFQTNKYIAYTVGWGKTGLANSPPHPPPPPIKCFEGSFYLSVFWIILLFHCILTLMNDLYQ